MDTQPDLWEKLTDSEKETFGKLQSTLGSPGWAIILQDITEKLEGLAGVLDNAQSWDQYNYARGLRDGLVQVINIPDRLNLEFAQAVQERAESEEAPLVGDGEAFV